MDKTIYIAIIPWDYSTASIIGVFESKDEALQAIADAKANEEENAHNAFIVEDLIAKKFSDYSD